MIDARVLNAYDRRARFYDAIVRMLSFGHDGEYRRRAVSALQLKAGERVLDIGCGTGLNAPYLERAVGPRGMVVGTDLSHQMLRHSPYRLRRVRATASQHVFKPDSFDAVLSTYTLSTLLGEPIIETIHALLRPGGRVVIADDALPAGWFVGPRLMIEQLLKHGWPDLLRETLRALQPYFVELKTTYCHFGMIYIISGVRRAP